MKFYLKKKMQNNKIIFFGSSNFSIFCLDELYNTGFLPILIVTTPDVPTGRGLKISPNIVKIWADQHHIPCLTPNKLDSNFTSEINAYNSNIFLVASYGKIIPKSILDLPKFGTLNIHPSLLPKYRGPSPLQEQIINDEKNIGVTIMLMDEKVDHGPIITQKKVDIPNWPIKFEELKKVLAKEGVNLLNSIISKGTDNKNDAVNQHDSEATFTKKVQKIDGLVDLEMDNPYKIYLKYLAYFTWPGVFFFINKDNKKFRVIIKDATFNSKDNVLEILKVLPEGKKEMSYRDFLNGLK